MNREQIVKYCIFLLLFMQVRVLQQGGHWLYCSRFSGKRKVLCRDSEMSCCQGKGGERGLVQPESCSFIAEEVPGG